MHPAGARKIISAEVVEFPCVSQYPDHADEFVRQAFPVCAPAGGERSGLIAHFLFAANSPGKYREMTV
jgi:hypothetical protein